MARRNREINIFNMSLLDILCGALGAFCFMMLTLLPFYMSGGSPDERGNDEARKKEVAEMLQNLDQIKQKIEDAELAEKLAESVKRLEARFRELEGELNSTRRQRDDLQTDLDMARSRVEQQQQELAQVREQLRTAEREKGIAEDRVRGLDGWVRQLEAQNQQLGSDRTALRDRLQDSENKRTDLANRLGQTEQDLRTTQQQLLDTDKLNGLYRQVLVPTKEIYWVSGYSDHRDQDLSVYIEAVKDGKYVSEPFDPRVQQAVIGIADPRTMAVDDTARAGAGRIIAPETTYRVYYSQYGLRERKGSRYTIEGFYLAAKDAGNLPTVQVTAERPWALVLEFTTDKNGRRIYHIPTPQEREKDWNAVNQRIQATPIPPNARLLGPLSQFQNNK